MTARITVALLFAIPAALAYPWQSTTDKWLLGVAVAVVVALFAWWRGLFVTTMLRRRIAILRRNRRGGRTPADSEHFATVTLRVDGAASGELPLPLLAGYVDRYGIRAHKVRIVSRDAAGARTTWIALTVGAADNLDALRARSARMPLRQTTEIAARRLTDHLRELGWTVTPVGETASPVPASARETWRGMRSDDGHVAAYRMAVDDDTLAGVAALPAVETWTALDIVGGAMRPEVIGGCAVRTADRPAAKAPAPGLTPQYGRHRPALEAMHPLAHERLEGTPAGFTGNGLSWTVDVRETDVPQAATRTSPA
ncbi:type VII secretion protein EccE [Mycobacterium sp. GA-2829]|uniref:type VII secretion protein EccE n=1 Tax=Mycobacterium sp. GA-2829 TaxID=1772283 RepID=UPI00073FAC8D|nr:type VII secretion protein EccE [Mycobacterium sp. GA-2829]KUI29991.1 type VII secretion protein EccE [Mycobacterium sp. GA-2829]